jgi:hypothetical protein
VPTPPSPPASADISENDHDNDVWHARLRLYHPALMTPRGRAEIAEWLRVQADQLEREGRNYAPLYSAIYFSTHGPAWTDGPK